MATTRTVFLDDDDVTNHVSAVQAAGGEEGFYNALTTICVGKKGANYILKNFKIHVALLENVFDSCRLKALGVTAANSEYFDTEAPSGAATPNRATGSGYDPIEKGTKGKAFSGRKVKVPLTTAMATGLRVYFPKAGAAVTRKTASILFPNIATIPQIGTWINTHLSDAKKADIPYFVMPSGTQYFIKDVAAPADLDKYVGEFATATAAALDDSGDVVESTP